MERAYCTPLSEEVFDVNVSTTSPDKGIDKMTRTVLNSNTVLPGLFIGFLVALVGYVVGHSGFALGLLFSLPIAILNLKAIDKILMLAFGLEVPELVRAVAFVVYHLRFLLLVVIMYMVIPKAGYGFAIGTFSGFLIAKIALAAEILTQE